MREIDLEMADKLYARMRRSELVSFFAPDCHPWDTDGAVKFLEEMIAALKTSKAKYPDGLPF